MKKTMIVACCTAFLLACAPPAGSSGSGSDAVCRARVVQLWTRAALVLAVLDGVAPLSMPEADRLRALQVEALEETPA